MKDTIWKGIWAIPVTPFDDDLNVVWDDIAAQVEFSVAAGAHGIAGPIVASEFHTLSDRERHTFYETVARTLDGRLPFVAGISGNSAAHSVELAAMAEAAGADALIAMAPMVGTRTTASTMDYFRRLLAATTLPMVLQNAPVQFTAPLPIRDVASLVSDHPRIVAVKEESTRNPQGMGSLVELLSGRDVAVFGGFGGLHLLNELSRGVRGTMVACEFTDVACKVFRLYEEGRMPECRLVFDALQHALVMELAYGMSFAKACLKKRGIIRTVGCREPYTHLDRFDQDELKRIWPALEAHFSI